MSDEMLRLGKKVYGADAAWRDESELRVYVRKDYGAIEVFDPANNSEQAWEVMAWLLRQHGWNCVGDDGVYFHMEITGWEKNQIPHNGTPAGIRAAVVEAAVRVAGGSK